MSSHRTLPVECFLLLCAMGWIDGAMAPEEAKAIVRAAKDSGLSAEALARVEAATQNKTELEELDVNELTEEDRLYLYAAASWVAWADGTIAQSERDLLSVLGTVLRVTPKGREEMDKLVGELKAQPEGERPSRFDLHGLHTAVEARLAIWGH